MDYLSFTSGNFTVDYSQGHNLVAYFNDGTTKIIDDSSRDFSFEGTCYLVANSINRDSNYNIQKLVGYSFYFGNDTNYLYYVSTSKLDFYIFNAVDLAQINLHAVRITEDYADLDDYSYIENYSHVTSYNTFQVCDNYGYFDFLIESSSDNSTNNSVVFDYTSLKYENMTYNSYKYDSLTVRGENISFYNTYFVIEGIDTGELFINYGNPISRLLEDEYQAGYNNGFSAGWVQGNENGYNTGINSNGDIGAHTATAFDYISGAFNAVGGIMSLEVLPNITLGLCFSIPLVFVLILTIFKLVRK